MPGRCSRSTGSARTNPHPPGLPAAHEPAQPDPRPDLSFRHLCSRFPPLAGSRGAAAQTSRLTSIERKAMPPSVLFPTGGRKRAAAFQALRSEIQSYWQILNRTMDWTPEERSKLRDSFFYDELVPRRDAMLSRRPHRQCQRTRAERARNRTDGLRRRPARTLVVTFSGNPRRRHPPGLPDHRKPCASSANWSADSRRILAPAPTCRSCRRSSSGPRRTERRNLARELHDEVGQSLSAILMEAEGADCAATPAEVREHLDAVRALAEKTVNEVRDLALLLRPSMLDDFGLVPALNWHAREIDQAHRPQRRSLRRRCGRRPSGRSQDLHLPPGTGGGQQLGPPCQCPHRRSGAAAREDGCVRFSVRDDGDGFETRVGPRPRPARHGGARPAPRRRPAHRFAAGAGNLHPRRTAGGWKLDRKDVSDAHSHTAG